MHWTLYIILFSTLFMSNLPFFSFLSLFNRLDLSFSDYEKIDKKFIDKFL